MEDRELLEMAAKACGGKVLSRNDFGDLYQIGERQLFWAPLEDDGDAFRLALKLSIHVFHRGSEGYTSAESDFSLTCGRACSYRATQAHLNDAANAARLAIVRVAAEIGRSMP